MPWLLSGQHNVAGLRSSLESWWDLTIGKPSEHKDRFHATSPINAIEQIRAPVLIIHGRLDYTVDIEQFRALVSQLKKYDKPHETLVKRFEGHGFHAEQNNMELYGRIEEFLARSLE